MRLPRTAACSIAFAIGACNNLNEGTERAVGKTAFAVTNAAGSAPEDDKTPAREAVVKLGEGCSGTVVTPRFILSATHCSADGWKGDKDNFYFGPDVAFAVQKNGAVTLPPTRGAWRRAALTGEAATGQYDMMILRLTKRVEEVGYGIRPAHISDPSVACASINPLPGLFSGFALGKTVRRKGEAGANCLNDPSAWGTTPGAEGCCVRDGFPVGEHGDSGGAFFVTAT